MPSRAAPDRFLIYSGEMKSAQRRAETLRVALDRKSRDQAAGLPMESAQIRAAGSSIGARSITKDKIISMTGEPFLELENVSVARGLKVVLHDISLAYRRRRARRFVGPQRMRQIHAHQNHDL